ncbi:uncharacterized protein RSE6_10371 [Rhynchosporium secalis]|uniref:Uncharacterized protein n=1 Tax=Rhynchosporium secalis TaxID=38038 RepID=A0A1E1MK88_RHYSE|nr:uncharacterized protein RSE6_10371 [Rhynchosporium secalis]
MHKIRKEFTANAVDLGPDEVFLDTPVRRLPPELILQIVDNMAASLSLRSKFYYSLLKRSKKIYQWMWYVQPASKFIVLLARRSIISQQIFLVPSTRVIPLPWNDDVEICPHFGSDPREKIFLHSVSNFHEQRKSKPTNKQGSICCDHFCIEFRVDFQSYGKAGNALFVTRWMDIGEGRDYDDHKFKIRFLSPWISPWNRVKADFGRGFQARFDLNAVRGERSVQESTSLRPEKKDVDISVREQNFVAMNGRLVLTPRYLVLRASEYERGEDAIYCMRSRYGEIFG